jgi:hypothetical protein
VARRALVCGNEVGRKLALSLVDVNLCFPREWRFAPDPSSSNVPIERNLFPSEVVGARPVRNYILGRRIERIIRLEVRKVGYDDYRVIVGSALPDHNSLPGCEIGVQPFYIVYAESGMRFAGLNKILNVAQHVPSLGVVIAFQSIEIDRVDLLSSVIADVALDVEQIVLIREFIPG